MTETGKHPHPEWAIAHILQGWKREVGPKLRRAYNAEDGSQHQRDLAATVIETIEGYARALRSVQ